MKVITKLIMGFFIFCFACGPRYTDNGTYQSGPGGATEEALATDLAETAVARPDSTPLIIFIDSLKREQGGL